MTFSVGWVLPRLGVGSSPKTVADAARLVALGVTHVLDVREVRDISDGNTADAPQKYVGTGITYHRSPMRDNGRQAPVSTYVDAVTFVKNAFAQPGTRVLIHCAAGMYRSPSVAYAVLRAMGHSPTDAWREVVSARRVARRQYIPGAEASVPSLPHVELVGGAGTPPPRLSTVTHSFVGQVPSPRPPGTPAIPAGPSIPAGVPAGAIVLGVVGLGIVGWAVYSAKRKAS